MPGVTLGNALSIAALSMMFLPPPWRSRVVLAIIVFPLGLGIGG